MWHLLSSLQSVSINATCELAKCGVCVCVCFIGISSLIVDALLLHLLYFLINSKHIAVDLLIDCL